MAAQPTTSSLGTPNKRPDSVHAYLAIASTSSCRRPRDRQHPQRVPTPKRSKGRRKMHKMHHNTTDSQEDHHTDTRDEKSRFGQRSKHGNPTISVGRRHHDKHSRRRVSAKW